MIKKTKSVSEKTFSTKISAKEYVSVLREIRDRIESSKMQAIAAVNTLLNQRNWVVGKILTEKQEEHQWGVNFLDTLANDLQKMYPGNAGFSVTNVYRMAAFYKAYANIGTAVPILDKLPIFSIQWGHNVVLLQKVKKVEERLWYAQKSIEEGWSRSTLEKQIKNDLFRREGKAITNFKETLPSVHSAMAQESFKDPYIFDFLKLQDDHIEYDLEQGLIHDVQKMLLELGKGFALVGRQYHLHVGDKDYYLDLLFYHFKLRCFVVVELKSCEFIPEFAGKLNFYLSAVDDLVRGPGDQPTIGLILCKTKNNFTAEYALRDINKPIGIAEYEAEIVRKLPKSLKGSLPTIEEIEAELEKNELISAEDLPKKEVKKVRGHVAKKASK